VTATSATDFIVAVSYIAYLLVASVGWVFRAERYSGTREVIG
jgi:hypothetical protein